MVHSRKVRPGSEGALHHVVPCAIPCPLRHTTSPIYTHSTGCGGTTRCTTGTDGRWTRTLETADGLAQLKLVFTSVLSIIPTVGHYYVCTHWAARAAPQRWPAAAHPGGRPRRYRTVCVPHPPRSSRPASPFDRPMPALRQEAHGRLGAGITMTISNQSLNNLKSSRNKRSPACLTAQVR